MRLNAYDKLERDVYGCLAESGFLGRVEDGDVKSYCGTICRKIQPMLKGRGWKVELVIRPNTALGSGHAFLIADIQGTAVVVDPTIGAFLPMFRGKVYIGSIGDLRSIVMDVHAVVVNTRLAGDRAAFWKSKWDL